MASRFERYLLREAFWQLILCHFLPLSTPLWAPALGGVSEGLWLQDLKILCLHGPKGPKPIQSAA